MPQRAGSQTVRCIYCNNEYRTRGIAGHERSCRHRNLGHRDNSPDVLNNIVERNEQAEANAILRAIQQPNSELPGPTEEGEQFENLDDFNAIGNDIQPDSESEAAPGPVDHELEQDDIRVVYHHSTGIPDQFYHFDDYCGTESTARLTDVHLGGESPSQSADGLPARPWRPFRTKLDFEVAEVMLDAHMNGPQMERTLSLIHEVILHPESFTLANLKDLSTIWDAARETRTEMFEKKTISVQYKDEDLEFDVYVRPLWSWCQELLLDRETVMQFVWDAQRLCKWTGDRFERFIDEPWTADAWWNYQNQIPAHAKPFCIILYADKTRLSSFGTEKGYPVVSRCANLPVEIRNSEGVGGGRLVGWLPIPEEDSNETGKRHFVNLKRQIWHRSMYEIISSIESLTETGYNLHCGDGVDRLIFPHILILSADYEEQCMMALTRGVKASFPCPVCLVPKEKIPLLSISYQLRTTRDMEDVWNQALELNATESEELLKSYGLRDVQNVFWALHGVDIYNALSWDRLHAYHGGLFSDHILAEIRSAIGSLPGRAEALVDAGLQGIPRWPGLNHFRSLGSTGEFADGTKFEDLSKVLIFAAHHVLTQAQSPTGFLLLKLLRSYLELDMYASLTVHTDVTLALGREELLCFEGILQEYRRENPAKNWDFPKAHSHQHMFRDIQMKGVTRNYNTKPSEKMNGPLKKFYRNHTNFKNVAPQMMKISEKDLAATIIRTEIERLAEVEKQKAGGDELDLTLSTISTDQVSTSDFERVVFGSRLPSLSIETLEGLRHGDPIFQNFRGKLGSALTRLLDCPRVILQASHAITPFKFIKVHYASVIDWRWKSNLIRANPEFHNLPRFDYGLVQVNGNRCIFVQLLYIFQVHYLEKTFNLVLALPLDAPRLVENRTRDNILRLTRVRPRRKIETVIIDANIIIRGGLVAPDLSSKGGELLVVDVIDEDMWTRLKAVEFVTRARL